MGFDHVRVNFDKDVTFLIGKNGSGKSTAGLTGIWVTLQGIAEKAQGGKKPFLGDRFRFIGPNGPSAKTSIVVHDDVLNCDVIITRKTTKTESTVTFTGPPMGVKLDQDWLNSFFDEVMISPSAFENLSPKEQAIALGLDLSEFDEEIKQLKVNYTLINQNIRALGKPEVPKKVEPVAITDLLNEINRLNDFNKAQSDAEYKLKELRGNLENVRTKKKETAEKIDELNRLMEELCRSENDIISTGKNLPKPEPLADLNPLREKLENAESINTQAREYERVMKVYEELDDLNLKLSENKTKQADMERKKMEKIRNMNLPFENLSVSEDGELLLEGRPIKRPHFSTGERIRIILALAASRNPELRYAYVQDFNLLDDDMQKSIINFAKENKIQLVIEYVGKDTSGKENYIVLEDCSVTEENVA